MRGEITWSDHAQEMIEEKRSEIGAERVEDAIRSPQQDFPADDTRRPGRRIAQKMIEMDGNAYLLRAFYDPAPEGVRIVSFYRTSQVKKYWRDQA